MTWQTHLTALGLLNAHQIKGIEGGIINGTQRSRSGRIPTPTIVLA